LAFNDHLKILVDELDRVHPGGHFVGSSGDLHDVMLNFTRARNGQERHYSRKARAAIEAISGLIHDSDKGISRRIELNAFLNRMRQCVADLHSEELLTGGSASALDASRTRLLAAAATAIDNLITEFTHYFPAFTLGIESSASLVIGPVMVMSRHQWIDSVTLHPRYEAHLKTSSDSNIHWKDTVKAALERPRAEVEPDGIPGSIYRAIKDRGAILKVTVTGYEQQLSRKVGQIISKSALDCLSLLLGGKDHFHQQALADERLPPPDSFEMLETAGHLWGPGMTRGRRFGHINVPLAQKYLADNADAVQALDRILRGHLDRDSTTHPDLCKRWTTALDWLAEGSRETNDAVALAKLATSLDVLACGGKAKGILGMLEHLTGMTSDQVVVVGEKPRTLRQLIEEIYNSGRSQILHGTHFDRLVSFEASRSYAAELARIALIESALRLSDYTGADDAKAFRTIPKARPAVSSD